MSSIYPCPARGFSVGEKQSSYRTKLLGVLGGFWDWRLWMVVLGSGSGSGNVVQYTVWLYKYGKCWVGLGTLKTVCYTGS